MAMVFSNASQAMPPWGSKQMLLGTNPFCMAAPAGKHRPIILDMSPAVAARGKIRRAERRGETIPLGYALDAQGRPTTDPKAALAGGVVLPIGEHKGSGICDVHGHFRRRDLGGEFRRRRRRPVQGVRPRAGRRSFLPGDEAQPVRLRGRLPRPHRHADRPHARPAPLAEGFSEVLVPGEPEDRHEAQRRSPVFPTLRARSKPCRTKPNAPASSRWWWPSARSGLDGQPTSVAAICTRDNGRIDHAVAAGHDIPGPNRERTMPKLRSLLLTAAGLLAGAAPRRPPRKRTIPTAGAADHSVPARRQQRRGRPHDRRPAWQAARQAGDRRQPRRRRRRDRHRAAPPTRRPTATPFCHLARARRQSLALQAALRSDQGVRADRRHGLGTERASRSIPTCRCIRSRS